MRRDWEIYYRTRKCKTCKATPIGLVDEPKESCAGTRRTKTRAAPRHVDSSRDCIFSSERAAWGGGGGGAARLSFFGSIFPAQQTMSGIGHRASIFVGSTIKTLKVRNSNNTRVRREIDLRSPPVQSTTGSDRRYTRARSQSARTERGGNVGKGASEVE